MIRFGTTSRVVLGNRQIKVYQSNSPTIIPPIIQIPISPQQPAFEQEPSPPPAVQEPVPELVPEPPVPVIAPETITEDPPAEEQSLLEPDEQPATEPKKPTTWASLFTAPSTTQQNETPSTIQPETPVIDPTPQQKADLKLSGFLSTYTPTNSKILLVPRGLTNNGNMCFMNALLQPLVHCPAFYDCFMQLKALTRINLKDSTDKGQLIEAMIQFLSSFTPDTTGLALSHICSNTNPFVPERVYDILHSLKKADGKRGHQEDAEEFFGFLLDCLHEEFLDLQNSLIPKRTDPEWTQVTKKSTRIEPLPSTPITKIFGGSFKSTVVAQNKRSECTEGFVTLQLSISSRDITSIEDALSSLSLVERLDDFMTGGVKIEATKKNQIEHLPPVLILHLKRFIYDINGGVQKVYKHVRYDETLQVSSSSDKSVQYTLQSVIYHHGKSATAGHFTTAVRRGDGTWIGISDDEIFGLVIGDVVRESEGKQAYMLFYGRIMEKGTLPGYFPLKVRKCIDQADSFFTCFEKESIPNGDKDIGNKALVVCFAELKEYTKCMDKHFKN